MLRIRSYSIRNQDYHCLQLHLGKTRTFLSKNSCLEAIDHALRGLVNVSRMAERQNILKRLKYTQLAIYISKLQHKNTAKNTALSWLNELELCRLGVGGISSDFLFLFPSL